MSWIPEPWSARGAILLGAILALAAIAQWLLWEISPG
jgi:hypothetical protein